MKNKKILSIFQIIQYGIGNPVAKMGKNPDPVANLSNDLYSLSNPL
jgi:hypothetical protein